MGYQIAVGETRPVIDQDGNPMTTANVAGEGAGPPFGSGSTAAIIVDDGAGNLVCVGNFAGTALFGFVRDGTTTEHTITVIPAPPGPFFDWSLGDPI